MPLFRVLTAAGFVLVATFAAARASRAASPEGHWKTVPDDDSDPATIRVWVENGKLFGKIVSIDFRPGKDQNPKCDKCQGSLKNAPILGLVILKDLTLDDDEWSGGTILDPANGETYRCLAEVQDDGKLKVRGYVGFSLLGRSQYWNRTAAPKPKAAEVSPTTPAPMPMPMPTPAAAPASSSSSSSSPSPTPAPSGN